MLTVDEYCRIRCAYRDGMGIREISRKFGHSRNKVREILRGDGEPRRYDRRQRQSAPKIGPVKEHLLAILKSDEDAPPKQRHTAQRLFERLRDEHQYRGSYDAIRKFVKRHRVRERETFIPLEHSSGRRMEADFGKIYVDFPEGRRQVSVLILVWSCSNAPYAVAMPTERTEAIIEGMQQAFEFFGCVPREVWWDNPKTVAEELQSGRDRKLNPRYAAFASHYAFEPMFCMPASGNEKPVVENRVKTLQRRWGTPVPCARDLQELNEYLRDCSLRDQSRPATSAGVTAVQAESAKEAGSSTVTTTSQLTIADILKVEIQKSAPLPRHRFEACVRRCVVVDKYQMARFDSVGYSVPRHVAFRTVTVKGFVDRVEIVCEDQVVATHARSYAKRSEILDPRHYLASLSRRPGALDHATVLRDWQLPKSFADLRNRLEQRHGVRGGVRHYVRVLQLLDHHCVSDVASVIEQQRGFQDADADRIIRCVKATVLRQEHTPQANADGPVHSDVVKVTVPSPGLEHFDSLLSSSHLMKDDPLQGASDDKSLNDCTDRFGCIRNPAAEVQSQTVATADNQPRVSETRPGSSQHESDLRAVPSATD